MYEQFSEVDVPPSDIVKTQQTPNLKILKGEPGVNYDHAHHVYF